MTRINATQAVRITATLVIAVGHLGCSDDNNDDRVTTTDTTTDTAKDAASTADTPHTDGATDAWTSPLPAAGCAPMAASTDKTSDGPVTLLAGIAKAPADAGVQWPTFQVQKGPEGIQLLKAQVTIFDNRYNAKWTTKLSVVAPAWSKLATKDAAAVVAQFGTLHPIGGSVADPCWKKPYPKFFSDKQGGDLFTTFGRIALDYGIPVIFGNPVPAQITLPSDTQTAIGKLMAAIGNPCIKSDSQCKGVLKGDGPITDCLMAAALATGELSYTHSFNYALVQSRVIDAGQAMLSKHYANNGGATVTLKRVWSIGNSKRGATQRVLVAIDPRVKGAVVGASEDFDMSRVVGLQSKLWKAGFTHGGPALVKAMESPAGEKWRQVFDTGRWKPAVLAGKSYVPSVGTNDAGIPLLSSAAFMTALPAGNRFLYVPNYEHGMGTIDHIAAFRAMVDHALNKTPWPRVQAQWDWDDDHIEAIITDGDPADVELWCSTTNGLNKGVKETIADCKTKQMKADDTSSDLRHAVWKKVAMKKSASGTWTATPLKTSMTHQACLVRVRTADNKVSTSVPLASKSLCAAAGLTPAN